jgi:prevent-host-death family protein
MNRVSTTAAQEQFPELIRRASKDKERTVLTSRGKTIAAIIPVEELSILEKLLEAREDTEDVAAVKQWRKRPGKTVSFKEICRKRGI